MADRRRTKLQGHRAQQQELNEYFEACKKAFDFSGVILLGRNGNAIWSGAAGFANLEHRVPNTIETKFRIASITKQFTAMAIMILQKQGKIDVSKPLSHYLSKLPKAWKRITVHHLLNHTSGLRSYTDLPEYRLFQRQKTSPRDLMKHFFDEPLKFAPGERFEYCNSGYTMLGILIEELSGETYADFLRDKIFSRLHMDASGVDDAEIVLSNRASGYTRKADGSLMNADFIDMSVPYSAGAMYSTAPDLLKWERALTSNVLISKAQLKAMMKSGIENNAYGLFHYDRFGREVIGHAGGIDGFVSNIEFLLDERLCSIILSNSTGAPIDLIARDLWAILLGEPYNLPRKFKPINVKPKLLDKYVGSYRMNPKFVIKIFREGERGERLMAQATGQSKIELFPYAKDKFFFREIYAQISFVENEEASKSRRFVSGGEKRSGSRRSMSGGKEGSISHLILHQGGVDRKAKRLRTTKRTSGSA